MNRKTQKEISNEVLEFNREVNLRQKKAKKSLLERLDFDQKNKIAKHMSVDNYLMGDEY